MTNANPSTSRTSSEAQHGQRANNNNQAPAFIHAEHQLLNVNRPGVSDELREQVKAALTGALGRVLGNLGRESKHRSAILKATGDVALACEGATWVAEMARHVFPEGDPTKPDGMAACAVLECETLRRLHGESVTIGEGLYQAMVAEPGWAAWPERFTEDGPLFFCAKVVAVSRFAGIDMNPLVHEAFAGFETSPQLHEACARLTEKAL